MAGNPKSLIDVEALIEQAVELLRTAEGEWEAALAAELLPQGGTELEEFEAVLHVATHETGNQLGFLLQDLKYLHARASLRLKYALFDRDEFERITVVGWSIGLVDELHKRHPSASHSEISELVKRLSGEWCELPKRARRSFTCG